MKKLRPVITLVSTAATCSAIYYSRHSGALLWLIGIALALEFVDGYAHAWFAREPPK